MSRCERSRAVMPSLQFQWPRYEAADKIKAPFKRTEAVPGETASK
jgi:hypothetical protein